MNELTKEDSKILKGIAIIFMLGLHLYNRSDTAGYYTSILNINGYPWIYYISFLFDACVPIYCFCAGYAIYIKKDYQSNILKDTWNKIKKLLKNYWLILIITCIIGIILKHDSIPNNLLALLGNIFLYDISYVGAWWFVQTYVLLTLTSKYLIKIIDNIKSYIIFIVIMFIYLISYYFRMMNPIHTNYYLLNIIINASVLYGTSLLPYVIGIMFNKYKITSKLRNLNIKFNNVVGILMIIICIIMHIIIKSMIVAPFIAFIFICAILIMNINYAVKKVLIYFGNHSTNIWLVHMQIYMIFFKDIVFMTDTVIGCFVILMGLSLVCSYFINMILNIKFIKKL